MTSTFAFGRTYSARARVREDLRDSALSLQGSSSSNASPQTLPTNPTDTPRESAVRVVSQIPNRRTSERSRPSIQSYNTEMFSGTARRSRKSLINDDGNSAHGSQPEGDVDPSKQLMLEAEGALELECQDSALSGDDSRESSSSSLTEAEEDEEEEEEEEEKEEEEEEEEEDDDEAGSLPRRSARLDTNGTAADSTSILPCSTSL